MRPQSLTPRLQATSCLGRRPNNNNKEILVRQALMAASLQSAGPVQPPYRTCAAVSRRAPALRAIRSDGLGRAAGRVEPLQAAIVAGLRVGACRRLGGALRPRFAPMQTCACRAPASRAATTPTAPPVLLDGPGAAPASRAASLMVLGKFENLTQRAVRRASRGHSRGRDKPQGPLARAHARARVVCLKKYKEV